MTEEIYGTGLKEEGIDDSMWESFKGLFSTGSEYEDMTVDEFHYERKMFDRKIEAFLDQNFTDFAKSFGIIDEVSLEVRTERVSVLENRSEGLISFIENIDKEVSTLEKKVKTLSKKK